MVRQEIDNLVDTVRREAEEMGSTLRDAATSVRSTFATKPASSVPRPPGGSPGVSPLKFKRFLLTLIKLLILFEFASALLEGASTGKWQRLGTDCIIAGVVYFLWDRIKSVIAQKKDEYRRKMERPGEATKLFDALVFSLLWSDEIYTDIPRDMRRLVVISYTLIAISIGAIFVGIGQGLVGLILCGSLILGAVNLLAWVMSRERGERESLETELKLAHDVQISLMPKEHPRVEGFDIAGLSIPAQEVGGDHFDYACMNGDVSQFCVSVFDVSGKGMQAAMSAVFTSGAFASEVKQHGTPGEVLTRMNKAVYSHSKRGHFVAFLLAVIDMKTRRMVFSNAGQMKPLLKSGGRVQWLDGNGVNFPLGMTEESLYQDRSVELSPGDVMLLLTDGFTEAMNKAREQFGMERLERAVLSMEMEKMASTRILDRIRSDVRLHTGDVPQHDDMTMVVVKVL